VFRPARWRWNYTGHAVSTVVVSVNVERVVVEPGDDAHLDAAWQLKERIRHAEGVLKQRWGFFADAYQRAHVHVLLADGDVIGFAAVRLDGYILFLAVDPEFRGRGFGRRLVARVAENHDSVSCHARATNEDALAFYRTVGFEVERRIDRYYEDGGDAYFLRLGQEGLAKKLSQFLGRGQ